MQVETLSDKEITKKSYQITAEEFASNVAELAPTESIKKFWSFFEETELTNMLQAAQFNILDFDTVEKKHT